MPEMCLSRAGGYGRRHGGGGGYGQARLTDQPVALVVKAHASGAGLDASLFTGHSLRRSFLISTAAAGKSIFRMKGVSRHKSVETLAGYVQ